MATPKQATAIVVDVGRDTGDKHDGRDVTDLEWAKTFINHIVTQKMLTGRKTEHIAIITFRADDDSPGDPSPMPHVRLVTSPQQFLMAQLRDLQTSLQPSGSTEGSAVDALEFAMSVIRHHTTSKSSNRELNFQKRIFLITSARARDDKPEREMRRIANIVETSGTNLYMFYMGDRNSGNVVDQLETLNGQFSDDFGEERHQISSFEDALDYTLMPVPKNVQLRKLYSGHLTLGDPQRTHLDINVEVYPCTQPADAPRASTFAVSANDEYEPLKRIYDFYPKTEETDDNAKGKAPDVEPVDEEHVEQGFLYGSEIVYFGPEEKELLLRYPGDSSQSLSIIGFSPRRLVPRWYYMSKCYYIVPEKGNNLSAVGLSALARAMYEQNTCAFARYVHKEGADVQVVALTPYIDVDFEGLVLNALPFSGDHRRYQFPSLTSTKGWTSALKSHEKLARKVLPSDDILATTEELVDAMMLEDDVDPADIFNPLIHRLNHAISYAAVHGNNTLPSEWPDVLTFTSVPQDVLDKALPVAKRLKTALDIKETAKKPKAVKKDDEDGAQRLQATASGLDVDALLDM